MKEAHSLRESHLVMCEILYGEHRPVTAMVRLKLVDSLLIDVCWDEALRMQKMLLDTLCKTLGEQHPWAMEVQVRLVAHQKGMQFWDKVAVIIPMWIIVGVGRRLNVFYPRMMYLYSPWFSR